MGRLGHEDRALVTAISALIKETPDSNFAPFTMSGHSIRKHPSMNQGAIAKQHICQRPDLRLPACTTEKQRPDVYKPPVYGIS